MRESQLRFILQQGFPAADASKGLYAALMFQPKVICCLIVIGALFQSAWLFTVLSAEPPSSGTVAAGRTCI